MITPPGLTAQLDQLAAATTDAYRRLARFGHAHDSPVHVGPVPSWLRPHLRRLTSFSRVTPAELVLSLSCGLVRVKFRTFLARVMV